VFERTGHISPSVNLWTLVAEGIGLSNAIYLIFEGPRALSITAQGVHTRDRREAWREIERLDFQRPSTAGSVTKGEIAELCRDRGLRSQTQLEWQHPVATAPGSVFSFNSKYF
jgi:hypothetical protein